MDYIFYFLFILVLTFSEYPEIFAPRKRLELLSKLKNFEEGDRLDGELTWCVFIGISYIILSLIGLLTSQWLLFLSITLMGIITLIIRRIIPFVFIKVVLNVIDGSIGFAIGIFIVINKFHLHFTMKEILNWIGL